MQNTEPININLDIFEGPMDLLLYLIKKDNLDIYDIAIAKITSQYLQYLEIMKNLNIDLAGEFLVMASTLMQIKSKMLLPGQTQDITGEGPDPRAELAEKISEYRKFKNSAEYLQNRFEKFKDVFYRNAPIFEEKEKILDIEIFDLISAVKKALERLKDKSEIVQSEEFPIEIKMEKIIKLLKERQWILLDNVFEGEIKKGAVIACFLALLELIKIRRIMAKQDGPFTEVRLYLRPKEDAIA